MVTQGKGNNWTAANVGDYVDVPTYGDSGRVKEVRYVKSRAGNLCRQLVIETDSGGDIKEWANRVAVTVPPEEIAARISAIQAGWSAKERRDHDTTPADGVEIKKMRVVASRRGWECDQIG